MDNDDYTFVTVESADNVSMADDAVVIDMGEAVDLPDAVSVDDNNMESTDFITMTDNNDTIGDGSMFDMNMDDLHIDGTDISIII